MSHFIRAAYKSSQRYGPAHSPRVQGGDEEWQGGVPSEAGLEVVGEGKFGNFPTEFPRKYCFNADPMNIEDFRGLCLCLEVSEFTFGDDLYR